jgi:pimeloyl-ACP methyl ester carboxylesterase
MTTPQIGRNVAGCLMAGLVVALGLVLGPVAGSPEHVITGTVLLTFAASWALLATRWAVRPAVFMAVAGAGVLAFAPGNGALEVLGWIWPPLFLAVLAATAIGVTRDLHSRSRFWIVYPLIGIYALGAIGGGYQTIRTSLERRWYPAPGQLVDVGGHQLHLNCAGAGAPTVILESGLGETGDYWGWISAEIARDTKVCTYDRAGRGWSEAAAAPQDGVEVARDLHTLLDRGRVAGPLVLVGHSTGAQYVRIFAGRYPEQVAGMVLLDGQPAEALESLPEFPAFYNYFRRVSALLPSLARLGAARLFDPAGYDSLPAAARERLRLTHSSVRLFRSLRDEFAQLPTALAQARSFQSLGDRPLIVVTATRGAMAGWLPLQDEMAKLSTNSRHEVVPYEHAELVTDEKAAQASSRAIRDVISAVRSASPLVKSSTTLGKE